MYTLKSYNWNYTQHQTVLHYNTFDQWIFPCATDDVTLLCTQWYLTIVLCCCLCLQIICRVQVYVSWPVANGNKQLQGVQCLGISPTVTPCQVVAMWVEKGLGLGLWHMGIGDRTWDSLTGCTLYHLQCKASFDVFQNVFRIWSCCCFWLDHWVSCWLMGRIWWAAT